MSSGFFEHKRGGKGNGIVRENQTWNWEGKHGEGRRVEVRRGVVNKGDTLRVAKTHRDGRRQMRGSENEVGEKEQ